MNPPEGEGAPWSVAVVDNHEAIRLGVVSALATRPDLFQPCRSYSEVGRPDGAGDGLLASGAAPRLVVLDLYLGRDDRASTDEVPTLREAGCSVVLYTSEERPVPLRRAVAAGVSGLVLKNDGVAPLVDALVAAAAGEFTCSSVLAEALLGDPTLVAGLTPRETQVLSGLDEGLGHLQVARRLGIRESTLKTHLKSVREKYMALGREVTNTVSLLRNADDDGWLDPRS